MGAVDVSSEITLDDEHEPEPAALPVGSVIGGKYAIKRVLGMGGNGAVYEAEHTAVGHRAAIKVAHSKRKSRENIMGRFEREARICGSLRHPHVGQVYDVGVLGDGSPYIVMELHEGRSLADVIDETPLPIMAIIDITRQLLAGLGAVHRAGFVHRDIKPDNVMIVRDPGGEVVVKLVDFGISKQIEVDPRARDLTGDGMMIGSPDYMPPEQLCGEAVDARTDLYAVGVLLYECITQRTPFDGASISDLIAAVLRDPVERPTALRAECPVELERVVLKALSRDRAQRYQTADEMSRALAEVRASTRAAPPTNLARLSERPKTVATAQRAQRRRTVDSKTLEDMRVHTGFAEARKPRKRTPLVVTAVVLSIAVAVLAWLVAREPPAEKVVTSALPMPSGASAAQQAASAQQQPSLSVTQPAATTRQAVQMAPAATSNHPARAAPEKALSAAAAPAPVVASKVRARVTVAGPARGSPQPETLTPTQDPQVTQSMLKQAATAFALGQTAQARSLYQQIVKASSREADAWRGLGVASSQLGERSEAIRAFRRYLELRPNAPDAPRVREQLERLQ